MKDAGIMATLINPSVLKTISTVQPALQKINVVHAAADFEREKLVRPFGFKGGYLTELWQVASKLQSSSNVAGLGLATQSVLYGDADLFTAHSEAYGNTLMFVLVNKALELVKRTPFTTPVQLLDNILPQLHAEAKSLTQKSDLNINFVYNALISVDNAAWLLFAAENKLNTFDAMVPPEYKKALGHHNNKIAIMYQIPYGMPVQDIEQAARQGYFVFKIKTGYPGTQAEMLEADIARLTQVHQALKNIRTEQTASGKVIYTMDANGRYEKKETMLRYLDHARKIGAFDQILLYEEPLHEENNESMHDVGIRIGADESVHNEETALRRLNQGYSVLVLKGIAKTLSMSMKVAKVAYEHNVPCLCADLTVNPILIDWHKNLAGRLVPFPEINMGLMETNGDMNYTNWKNMMQYHPAAGAAWMQVKNGVFELDNDFYARSGGMFEPSAHYEAMFPSVHL